MAVIDQRSRHCSLEAVERVPEHARVRHVDELDERSQAQLFALVDGDAHAGRIPPGTSFEDGEIIVYTDYYRIDLG